jgi:hypothetical protein
MRGDEMIWILMKFASANSSMTVKMQRASPCFGGQPVQSGWIWSRLCQSLILDAGIPVCRDIWADVMFSPSVERKSFTVWITRERRHRHGYLPFSPSATHSGKKKSLKRHNEEV